MRANISLLITALCLSLIPMSGASAYPLDGFDETGISRLEGYYYSLRTASGKQNFVPGALLSSGEIGLHLTDRAFDIPAQSAEFSNQINSILGADAGQYSIAVLDFSDPSRVVYGSHNELSPFIPGSAAKVLVAMALFQTLADIYPDKIQDRIRILRDTEVEADEFALPDTHEVPFWHKAEGTIEFRPVQAGDRANLWSYLDWMLSASSNGAGSMVMRELLLLKHFGRAYPSSPEAAKHFLESTPKSQLAGQLQATMHDAIRRNGLDGRVLSHASFFTRGGKERVPSSGSSANVRELVRLLLFLEEGRLVDKFSSLEIKRLIYTTQTRIRYAASPQLDSAAVYYKSGSLFRCKPEPGFGCSQYHGNALNLMNSLAIIEYPYENPRLRYIVAISSNVLRRDSAQTHADIAGKLQELLERRHSAP